ncbi:polyribonucleotide nucleotidyltransferase [Geochorda subterranea]|uniref:Polyribonucleotide nucleotidyltransferase n=1 Tax=Geochorda subterranea TaxID=3109564 RepID=A0ABZ1BL84_9FIRM|nr:polyribonucleotide nucleotidyltransferase [Limnochorda sp. LNt]WRP13295.1 polyribonucleotide nucleotidyltransferase [Limnochorda sp. LNt]
MFDVRRYEMELAGRELVLETGRLARQAGGAVWARYGDTVVLVTATMSRQPREGIDFFPLLVDFEERMYAVGKIPGGWGRREGKPGEAAILSARMVDRPIRPLFPEGFRNDVQVVVTTLSVDHDAPPDVLGIIGASAALTISEIPFLGPVGAVRMGLVDGQIVVNPTADQQRTSRLNLVVAGTRDAIMMVEAGADEVPEEQMLDAIMRGHEEIQRIVALIDRMRADVGKPKVEVPLFTPDPAVKAWVEQVGRPLLAAAVKNPDKMAREEAVERARQEIVERFVAEHGGEEQAAPLLKDVETILDKLLKDEVRRMIVEDGERPDGRAYDEIRPIYCEVGLLPRVHGSGLFVRGQTQVLTSCTLGLKSDEQLLDDLREEDRKRYIHHYNFPPYSVGEVRPMRAPGRREIGHGALAERALLPVIPPETEFPYTIRLVSEVLESNGSTSQASVCGSTLALMDAGVPIRKPVAGVAMGLVKWQDRFVVLTDIQGIEDALGDMDFKVAGTVDGVTAIQMDIKVHGITREILARALEQARAGRLFILDKMLQVIPKPRPELSPRAPRIITLEIPVDKIRDVIGPGGKMIRKIIEQTGVEIDVEDDGRVYIASTDEASGKKAAEIIQNLVRDVEVGAVYLGKVKRTTSFGAFVEILPGKEGLVHISELAPDRVGRVEDVVQVGDEVLVKVTEIDRLGRINLSRKEALPASQRQADGQPTAPRGGGDERRRRDGRGEPRRPGGFGRRPGR